ncbi:unnamed protein product [Moneuplotes crassus]|uniref:Uncharacterized protein n=1 Tax=Euplotes crassus TaxID=5936 RepID=A0AAD1UP01_EUPCR|nr:unnamed protein product [Moneuplotes crassus]
MAKIHLGEDSKSLAVRIVAHFTRAIDAEVIQIVETTSEEHKEEKLLSIPALVTSEDGRKFVNYSPYSIIEHICKLTHFQKGFVGKSELQQSKILSYFEVIEKQDEKILAEALNNDLKLRTYLAGYNITAADIFAYAHIITYAKGLSKKDLSQHENLFRWIDQIQHSSGIQKFAVDHDLLIISADDLVDPASMEETKEAKPEKNNSKKDKKQQNKGNKQKNNPPAKKQGEVDYKAEPVTLVDFRVGHIVKVWPHPDSDYLYCCSIDIGEEEPRSIATGLQKVVPIEVIQDAMVIVAANLKARNMGDFKSDGMVLCSENEDATNFELLTPPEGAVPGEFVTFEGYGRNPPDRLNKKKKIFETVQPHFKLDGEGIAHYKDAKWLIGDKGPVYCKTFRNGAIS